MYVRIGSGNTANMSVSAARTEIRNTESTYWQYAHYVVIVVVFTLNRSFYQRHTSAVHPVSVLILHPREILEYY